MTQTKFLTEHISSVTELTLELAVDVIHMLVCTCISVKARGSSSNVIPQDILHFETVSQCSGTH